MKEAGSAEEDDVGFVKVGEVTLETEVLGVAVIAQGGGGKGQQSPGRI